jgi:hypothetical protein
MTTGRRCARVAERNLTICSYHREADERNERYRRDEIAFNELLEERLRVMTTNRETVTWYVALQMLHIELRGGTITRRLFVRLSTRITFIYRNEQYIDRFDAFNTALTRSHILPIEMAEAERDEFINRNLLREPPAPIGELGNFAADRQNVHTKHVSKQTNEGLEKLLKMTIPPEQNTKKAIARAWMAIYALKDTYWKVYLDVLNDMHIWYETESCRQEGDRLYRRVLDGAWALIQTSKGETKYQLIKRLYEESRDACQMCSEGHITRIANVFCGFDDSFKGDQSIGEKIQEAMSEISLQDISRAAKISLAKNLFVTLGITEEERAPWIDAL